MRAQVQTVCGDNAVLLCLDGDLPKAPFLKTGVKVKLLLPVSVLQNLNEGDTGELEVVNFAGNCRLKFVTKHIQAIANFSLVVDPTPEVTL